MTEFILVLTATASKDEAQAIADVTVEQRLAAAVHIIGPAAILTVLGDQSFEQVCHTLRQTHQRLIALLKSQDESIFVPDNSVYQRVIAMTDHSSEHAKGLDKPD